MFSPAFIESLAELMDKLASIKGRADIRLSMLGFFGLEDGTGELKGGHQRDIYSPVGMEISYGDPDLTKKMQAIFQTLADSITKLEEITGEGVISL